MNFPTIQLELRPGIIDLGWGHPDGQLLPVAALQQAASQAFARYGSNLLAYGADRGAGPLLNWLSQRIHTTEGREVAHDQIMITGGNSHALELICSLICQPNDLVLVESPTYHLAVKILRDHPLELLPVPIDQDGLYVDGIEQTLQQLQQTGRSPRMLYTVPTFHNPTGVNLSLPRRHRLIELAQHYQFLIIEDDVYRDLAYDQPALPSLWSMAPAGVVARLGSFAKTLAPGLRLGWITGGATLITRLVRSGLLDSGGGTNHLAAMIVAELCQQGGFEQQVEHLRHNFRSRRNTLVAGLQQHLPTTCSIRNPAGGFFVWVDLPATANARDFLGYAQANGVAFLPGTTFHLDGRGAPSFRVAFSLYPEAQLREATERLGVAFQHYASAHLT